MLKKTTVQCCTPHSRLAHLHSLTLPTFLCCIFRLENFDPLWPSVGMGVVTCPKLAFKLQVNQSSVPVRLSLWNGTSVAFPNKTIASATSLFKWVQAKAIAPPVTWTDVAGRKSINLGDSLLKGTANSLLAFLPNPSRYFRYRT